MKNEKSATRRSARVVEVIPISRGIAKPALSYFTTRNISVGSFVKVPIRNSSVPAIVAAVHDASKTKTNIKNSSFSLKKIDKTVKDDDLGARLPEAFIVAAQKTAHYYASPLGPMLSTLLPKVILENFEIAFAQTPAKKTKNQTSSQSTQTRVPAPKDEPLVLQLGLEERMSQYRSIIRESLAKKNSIMLVVPTEEEALRAFKLLSHGIEDYAHLFTLGSKLKDQKNAISKAKNPEHSVLLVTTPAGISLDRPDLHTIILERESSRAYRTLSRPYIHLKTFLEYYAARSKKRLILGDSVLSIETLWKERSGEYREFFPLTWRLTTNSTAALVDMKRLPSNGEDKSIDQAPEKPSFRIISPELEELIQKALDEEKGIFLFGARKGLSPTTICADCESILSCKNCGAPVVLYKQKPTELSRGKSGHSREEAATIYSCHACGARRSSHTVCDICKSWRLTTLGIGIDRIKEEVSNLFPKAKIHVLDKNHASTPLRARKIAEDFKENGGVLIGTELGLLHVDKAPYTALVSADSLFSIPDFGIHERIFHLVTHLKEMAEKEVIIQTRNIGKQVLAWATYGNIIDFYREEIAEREEMQYPPFSIFIKITGKNISGIKETFEKWKPDVVKDSLIIRISMAKWPSSTGQGEPDTELASHLSLLTPDFLIKVDPESIL